MKLYFAGDGYEDIIVSENANYLVSFFYRKQCKSYLRNTKKKVFLDSGGFSAMTQGKDVNISEYCEFIEQNRNRFDTYAALDVIGDWEATKENTEYMESKGLKPLPTFHYGSPFSELERLVEKYDYIALGGLVPIAKQRKKMQYHLDKCFSIIRNKCKIHGFGVNALWAWNRYPFYSVDASSWLAPTRYGSSHFIKDQHLNRFESKNTHYKERVRRELRHYTKQAKEITRLWAKRGIIWE